MACGSGLTRGATSLTQRSIEALRPAETAYRVSDQRCIGLAVRVAPSGIKTWDLAYRIRSSGKTRRLSLGRVCDVSLEKARDRANKLTSAARTGRDLIAEEEERITPLVGLARQVVQARVSTVQSGPLFRAETGTTLTAAHVGHYLLARCGKLPIDKFTTHERYGFHLGPLAHCCRSQLGQRIR